MSSIKGETIPGIDLTLVELIGNIVKKESRRVLSNEDIAWQEARRQRKVKRLDFEVR